MTATRRYRRMEGVAETLVEDEAFLILPDSGDLFHLDRLALALWRALEEPADDDELVDLFADVFPDTPRETIKADLDRSLNSLLAGGLIHPVD
ncbi:MAG: PqqD family protein [Alphaproteobacteria bacterium]|jgi:hypothetical protein|nr:PqqD family protein [Alphaproteobacteria bacterium]MDP6564865.1 PqqD family protein [Alphaproteobacteria bacterium]MDP6815310.1 PqqD family protein [Alphaproteobacteria bacterium]